jgi:hypothetical protein
MIAYTEKGYGLHAAIQAAGHWLREQDGVWLASDDAAVQAIIDGYSLTDAIAAPIAAVKALARQKILAFLPEWKQSNYNARMNELNDARFSRALTPQEESEIAVMRTAWDTAKAIRAASDAHETALRALDSFAEITAYDITAGWPES